METINAVAALAAIAQESRLAVFRLLVQAGPAGMAAGKISEAAGIPPSSLSFHLKELAHAGMVTSRQEGRFVIYEANFSTATNLVAFLTENCCGARCATCLAPRKPGRCWHETSPSFRPRFFARFGQILCHRAPGARAGTRRPAGAYPAAVWLAARPLVLTAGR